MGVWIKNGLIPQGMSAMEIQSRRECTGRQGYRCISVFGLVQVTCMMQNDFTERTNQNLNHVRAMILLANRELKRLMHSNICHKVTLMSLCVKGY